MRQDKKARVAIAMSGGVDSSVAAALLKRQGYDVVGVFMRYWYSADLEYGENRCCSLESFREAQAVGRQIGIEVVMADFSREFKRTIVDKYIKDSAALKTPNPCINCNKSIKFDLLLRYVIKELKADFLATGHYVRVTSDGKGKFGMERPVDLNKDQTYFMYNLKQSQLKRLMFPLAEYHKDQVRQIAEESGFKSYNKKDSQEICFVGKSRTDFLKNFLEPKPGDIVDAKGKVLGAHQGLPLYTPGQRNGLGLSGGPWYVIGFDRHNNRLIVGPDFNSAEIQTKIVKFKSVNWLDKAPQLPFKCLAQIRYRATPEKCVVRKIGSRHVAEFAEPQRAATAGQSIVFYDGDKLLGGGVIVK